MTAHLLTIGDEILIGQIVDTNSAWMSRALNMQGIRVTGKSSVGDLREAIIAGVEHAATTADIILITGGLGPTKDDITKTTLAEMFDSPMVFHQPTYDWAERYFKKIGRPVPPAMHLQATLPEKATILSNKVGSAPGMWFESKEKVYISLPGVPFEMEHLMTHEVLPRLSQRFPSRPIAHRTVQTVGEGESNIAQRLEAFEEALPAHIKLAYLPSLGQVRLRLTGVWPGELTPTAAETLNAELDSQKDTLVALVPELIYGYDDTTLEQAIGAMLLAQGKTFGTAESCTGGYVAHLITQVPGASAYFAGSVVSYSNAIKEKMLGVPSEMLATEGAVSEATVRAMAEGAVKALGVSVAFAVSGIAGPGGGTPDKPVGLVWMAVSDGLHTITQKHIFGRDRSKNIHMSGVYGLNLVRKFLLDAQ